MTTPSGEFNLGRPRAYIEVNADGVRTGIADAQQQLNNFRQSMASWVTDTGRQVRNFGAMWSAASIPLVGAMQQGISAAANFDEALIEIQARTGLTSEAMDQVRDTAMQLGADTVFSTQQAANSFLQLLTAGLSTEEALATLPGVLDAAAAGGLDLGTSADIVTNVMSAFNLSAEESTQIIEAMSRAAASSPADMLAIGEAMQRAGGMASSLGLDVNRTAAIFSIFAQNGLRGSEAGTQLNSMLRNMSRQTPDVQAAWDELGVSMFDAQGNMRDLDTVFTEIAASMENMTMEDQNRIVTTLAGSYGMLGFNAILGSQGIAQMEQTMSEQASASEVAQARMASFKGQLNSLMGSVQTLMISAFTPFMNNVLRPLVTMTISVVNAIRDWTTENEALTQTIVSLLALAVALGPGLMIVGQAMMIVGGLIGVALSPIGLLIGGLSALAYMFREHIPTAIAFAREALSILFLRDFQGFGAFAEDSRIAEFIFNIRDSFTGLYEFATSFLRNMREMNLGQAILSAFGRGRDTGMNLFDLFQQMGFSRETAIRITNQIFTVFSMWFTRLRTLFTRVSDAVMPAFREIMEFLGNNSGGIANFAGQLFRIGTFLLRLASPIGMLRNVLTLLGIDLLEIFEGAMGGITRFFATLNDGGTVLDALRAMFNDASWFNTLVNGFTAVSNFITNQVIPALTNVWNFLTGLWTAFTESGWSGAATFIQDNLITPIQNAWNNIDWSQVATTILNGLGTAIATAGTWATWIWNNILSPLINNAVTAIATTDWSQVGSDILNGIGTAIGLTFDFLTWLTTNVLAPMVTNAATAIESINWFAVGEGIVNAIGTALTTTFDFIAWIVNSIFNPITDNADGASTGIDWYSVGETILTAVKDSLIATFNFIQWLIDTIFQPLINGAASAITQTDWSAVGTNLMDAIKNALPNIAQWVQTNIIAPIQNALSGFNPLTGIAGIPGSTGVGGNAIGAASQAVSPGSATQGSIGILGSVLGGIRNLTGFATGTNFVSNDMVANIHRGEAIIPAANNPFNPNASSPFTGSGGGSGTNIESIQVIVNPYPGMTPAEAERIGASAGRGFKSELRGRGLSS